MADLQDDPVAPADVELRIPAQLTPELRDVLGMMCFECGPIAHAFRATGVEIKRRAEDEQAFIMHWLLTFVAAHGSAWRRHAGEALTAVIARAKEAEAAHG